MCSCVSGLLWSSGGIGNNYPRISMDGRENGKDCREPNSKSMWDRIAVGSVLLSLWILQPKAIVLCNWKPVWYLESSGWDLLCHMDKKHLNSKFEPKIYEYSSLQNNKVPKSSSFKFILLSSHLCYSSPFYYFCLRRTKINC